MDPTTDRFWTMDPSGEDPFTPATQHRYLYANANPVDLADPGGLAPSNLTAGRIVHRAIGIHFVVDQALRGSLATAVDDELPDDYDWIFPGQSDRTINGILALTGGQPIAGPNGLARPDLVNITTREVYEIKSINSWPKAYKDLVFYLGLLRGGNLLSWWHPGISYSPPPIIPVDPTTVALVAPPVVGAIFYTLSDKTTIAETTATAILAAGAIAAGVYVGSQAAVAPLRALDTARILQAAGFFNTAELEEDTATAITTAEMGLAA